MMMSTFDCQYHLIKLLLFFDLVNVLDGLLLEKNIFTSEISFNSILK